MCDPWWDLGSLLWSQIKEWKHTGSLPLEKVMASVFWLVRFYGISTLVSYLMPNPVYTYRREARLCLACKMNGMSERERQKRNMATLIPLFKIKCSLKWREFARVAYANFFEAGISAKHKTPHVGERSVCKKTQSSEDVIFVGRDE